MSDTQIEGLKAIQPKTPVIRERVVALLKEHGALTDTELVDLFRSRWGYDNYRSVGARRRELVLSGLVQDTGDRKVNSWSGVNNILWDVV